MAITCKWENLLGTCYSQYDKEKKYPLTIYGGGNVIACFCDVKKNLVNFIIDKEHFKNCEYNGNEYLDITIYRTRKKESKKLIDLLVLGNFEFKVLNEQPE